MRLIKAPQWYPRTGSPIVFLAGTIDMGTGPDWQAEVAMRLASQPVSVTVLNPRRDDWDDTWEQSIDNEQFRNQVEWELQAMEDAAVIVVHFAPDSFSPITLLELGLAARQGKAIVYCPEGFYRKGNVDIVCARYNVRTADSLDDLVHQVIMNLPDVRPYDGYQEAA